MTPMRLQRALARAGVTSRRKAEELIRAGRVRVDGRVATLGMSVDPGGSASRSTAARYAPARSRGWRSTSPSAMS